MHTAPWQTSFCHGAVARWRAESRYNEPVGRSVFYFVLGVLSGVALAEALRWGKSEAEERDFESLTERLSDKFDDLESSLPVASAQ